MPIYAYKCSVCSSAADVLQKISDDPLTVCPSCGQATYVKQLTAAGFQLKGSGWYVTDFRNNGAKPDGAAKSAEKGEGDKDGAEKSAQGDNADKAVDAAAGKSAEGTASKPVSDAAATPTVSDSGKATSARAEPAKATPAAPSPTTAPSPSKPAAAASTLGKQAPR